MAWELDDKQSIYGQLIRHIRQRILNGYYPPGAKIDSVRELAEEAGVNPNTMQRALSEMEREGILRAERTSGRFVTEDSGMIQKIKAAEAEEVVSVFLKEMRALGLSDAEIQTALKAQLRKGE